MAMMWRAAAVALLKRMPGTEKCSELARRVQPMDSNVHWLRKGSVAGVPQPHRVPSVARPMLNP
jgi:hypothetical protein